MIRPTIRELRQDQTTVGQGTRLACVTPLAAAVLGAALLAQDRAPGQFRSITSITRLELTVLDAKSRKPVTGLTADDFVVKVNGARQRLVALSEGTARRDAAGPTTSFPGVARDVADNSRVAQRLFVILMNDAVSTNDPVERQNGKEIARRVVDALGPDDLAAVVFCRDNRHAQDFTPDRALLRAAIDTFNPVPAIYQAPVLNNVVRFLSEVPGVRRSVVYISATGGLATTRADTLADIVGLIDDGSLPFTIADISGIGTARGTSASHIPVYLFHTSGLKAPSREDVAAGRVRGLLDPSVEDTFRSVAAMTGGRAVWANNAPAELVPAMFEELSAYYILGFEPDYPLDGRLRWLQVELKRPGLVVYPSNVPLSTPRDALWGQPSASIASDPPSLVGALSGALPTGAIPLRLAPMVMPAEGGRDHTLIAVLGLPPLAGGSTAEEYDLTIAVFDGEGRRELQRQQHVVSLTAGDTTTRGVVDIPLRLSLRPGRYNVRSAVVRRRTGTAGSVYATVVMPDFARESLTLSAAALGDPRAPLRATDPLAKFLPFAPTVRRTFTTVDQVTAYLTVHQPTGKAAAAVELVSEILSEDGATVRRAARTIPAAAFAGVPGVALTYDLAVSSLPPGAYLARFTALSPTGRAERTVSFVVR